MGKSNPVPVFFISAGVKLIVTNNRGMVNPAAFSEHRTRERDSIIELSGMPTMVIPGMPPEIPTSTSTGIASIPLRVAV